jgi:hypothetical protein
MSYEDVVERTRRAPQTLTTIQDENDSSKDIERESKKQVQEVSLKQH